MVRWMAAAVMAADGVLRRLLTRLGSRAGKRANLACPFPAWHQILVELHELDRRGHGLFLVPQFEDRVATDDLLGLHEWAVDDAKLAVRNAHLRARGNRHQPATVEHAAGLDLPVGQLVHR